MGSRSSAIGLGPWHCALLLGLGLIVGCEGRATGKVTGRVTYRGQPVVAGQVTFLAAQGRTVSAPIKRDGTYTLYGAPLGRVLILVQSKASPQRVLKEPPNEVLNLPLPGAVETDSSVTVPGAGPHDPLPERYSRADQSGLVYIVRRGEQTYDLVLVP